MICPKCGYEYSDTQTECPKCGEANPTPLNPTTGKRYTTMEFIALGKSTFLTRKKVFKILSIVFGSVDLIMLILLIVFAASGGIPAENTGLFVFAAIFIGLILVGMPLLFFLFFMKARNRNDDDCRKLGQELVNRKQRILG